MHEIRLRSTLIIFLLFLLSLGLQAQQNRFIYLQTENKQPFYIKMDKKIFSSSASGHIIISKLIDSIYQLTIGFPENEWPEQNVTVSLINADAGFFLKNLGEKGWGLINLQTKQILMSEKKPGANDNLEKITNNDEFAKILSLVVNDPSILQNNLIKNETAIVNFKPDDKIESKAVDSEAVKQLTLEVSNGNVELKQDAISKLMYDSTGEGVIIKYLDIVNNNSDTVNVFIPADKAAAYNEPEKPGERPNAIKVKEGGKNKDSRFIDMELQNPNLQKDTALIKLEEIVINDKKTDIKKQAEPDRDSLVKNSNGRVFMINSDCKKTANEKDFLKLRKQMAEADEYKLMIKAANKQFIITCFTTEQIKNLGFLFLKEEERYKFFVAAFPFVADTHNYASLQDQLTDNYYIVRFKAMVNH